MNSQESRIEFIEWCRCLDGNFATIIETPSYVLAVVDLVRSYLYIIAKAATRLNLRQSQSLDPRTVFDFGNLLAEICAAGFTSVDCTIFQDVKLACW